MSLQKVLRDAHRFLQIPLRVLLSHNIEAVAVNRVHEPLCSVNDRLHRRGIEDDDVAAVRALLHKIFAYDLACVVVIGAGVGDQIGHIRHLRVEADHRNVVRLRLVQCRKDSLGIDRIDEEAVQILRKHILNLRDLLGAVVARIGDDQRVAVRLDLLLHLVLNRDEERVRSIHAGIAELEMLARMVGRVDRFLSRLGPRSRRLDSRVSVHAGSHHRDHGSCQNRCHQLSFHTFYLLCVAPSPQSVSRIYELESFSTYIL